MQIAKYIFSLFFIMVIISLAYYRNVHSAESLNKQGGCSIWQNYANDQVKFRRCTDKNIPSFNDFQFYNGYPFMVNIVFAVGYPDESINKTTLIIEAKHVAEKTLNIQSWPSSYAIIKKQRKDSQGNWVDF